MNAGRRTQTAILAGGCFWGMQELVRRQPGVLRTRVGYTGGSNVHPTYQNHPGGYPGAAQLPLSLARSAHELARPRLGIRRLGRMTEPELTDS